MPTFSEIGQRQVGVPAEQSIRLEKRLLELKPGESVSVASLCEYLGCTPAEFDRTSWWTTARKNAEQNGDMVLARRERTVYRLTDSEAVDSFSKQLWRDNKQARKTVRRLTHVQPRGLPQTEQASLVALQSVYAAVAHIGKPKLVKQLEGRVSGTDSLPLDATIGYFLGHTPNGGKS